MAAARTFASASFRLIRARQVAGHCSAEKGLTSVVKKKNNEKKKAPGKDYRGNASLRNRKFGLWLEVVSEVNAPSYSGRLGLEPLECVE